MEATRKGEGCTVTQSWRGSVSGFIDGGGWLEAYLFDWYGSSRCHAGCWSCVTDFYHG